mmetsp:Transcript_30578/g.76016  ORF Transcript_30578/g.76016 Transcript_30578/m.76016 type:complete len:460 (-) Transcript_30578:465-1844(-)
MRATSTADSRGVIAAISSSRCATIATVPGVCHVSECLALRSLFHPPWFGIFPARVRSRVVLPLPDGPMMAVTWPAIAHPETPERSRVVSLEREREGALTLMSPNRRSAAGELKPPSAAAPAPPVAAAPAADRCCPPAASASSTSTTTAPFAIVARELPPRAPPPPSPPPAPPVAPAPFCMPLMSAAAAAGDDAAGIARAVRVGAGAGAARCPHRMTPKAATSAPNMRATLTASVSPGSPSFTLYLLESEARSSDGGGEGFASAPGAVPPPTLDAIHRPVMHEMGSSLFPNNMYPCAVPASGSEVWNTTDPVLAPIATIAKPSAYWQSGLAGKHDAQEACLHSYPPAVANMLAEGVHCDMSHLRFSAAGPQLRHSWVHVSLLVTLSPSGPSHLEPVRSVRCPPSGSFPTPVPLLVTNALWYSSSLLRAMRLKLTVPTPGVRSTSMVRWCCRSATLAVSSL